MNKKKWRFEEIDILLVDPDLNFRQTMAASLGGQGFRVPRQGNRLSMLEENIKQVMPDLLICDSDLPDGDFTSFMHTMRHEGDNPFLPVICMVQNPTVDQVRKVIDSGSDDLLTKPVSPQQLMERIIVLIKARKPFVVTSDYIGPTRRAPNRSFNDIPLMEVPNPLRAKALGEASKLTQSLIDDTISEINLQKLERYANQICYLVDRIAPVLETGEPDQETKDNLNRLLFVGEDMSRRQVGTKYAHVSDLCQSLITVTGTLNEAEAECMPKDIELMKHLAQAIQAGFDADEATAEAARKISASVNRDQAT